MINFNNYIKHLLSEDIHPDLKSIISSGEGDPVKRYSGFLKKVRELDSQGIDTGLQNIKPNKGSSRAVFIPKDNKEIILDGQRTQLPYVYKMAIHGHLDRFKTPDEPLLGELQNAVESDDRFNSAHGIIVKNRDGSYSSNPHGLLVPFFSRHPDWHHLEMGYARDMRPADFPRMTVTPEFTKGLKYVDFYRALMKEYYDANGMEGQDYGSAYTDEKHEKVRKHPLVKKAFDLVSLGIHPGDFIHSNMGIWTHPITGIEHPVARDFGATTDVLKQYNILMARDFGILPKGETTNTPLQSVQNSFDNSNDRYRILDIAPSPKMKKIKTSDLMNITDFDPYKK